MRPVPSETRPCSFCGAPITRKPYRFTKETIYCDSTCRNKHVAMKDRPMARVKGDIVHIPLSQGQWAKVDRIDYESIPMLKEIWTAAWYKSAKTFYAIRRENKTAILMHRIITRADDGLDVNHRDHDGLNNTRNNIEVCTHQENLQYSRKRPQKKGKEPTSRYKGVSYVRHLGKWTARIGDKHLGVFPTEEAAAIVYNLAAKEKYGHYAQENKII